MNSEFDAFLPRKATVYIGWPRMHLGLFYIYIYIYTSPGGVTPGAQKPSFSRHSIFILLEALCLKLVV